jgi:hypothetical protein
VNALWLLYLFGTKAGPQLWNCLAGILPGAVVVHLQPLQWWEYACSMSVSGVGRFEGAMWCLMEEGGGRRGGGGGRGGGGHAGGALRATACGGRRQSGNRMRTQVQAASHC